jgi:hypothetical protein
MPMIITRYNAEVSPCWIMSVYDVNSEPNRSPSEMVKLSRARHALIWSRFRPSKVPLSSSPCVLFLKRHQNVRNHDPAKLCGRENEHSKRSFVMTWRRIRESA